MDHILFIIIVVCLKNFRRLIQIYRQRKEIQIMLKS